VFDGLDCSLKQAGAGVGVFRWRGIVVARPLVAKRALDDNKIWGNPCCDDLPRRRQADQQAASAGEKLFSHQNGERSADRAPDDADLPSGEAEDIEFGVIAWPTFERLGTACSAKMAHKVAVGIEQANGGDMGLLDVLLAPRFPHQRRRYED
jgi:hypothetical protein